MHNYKTSSTKVLSRKCIELFDRIINPALLVRKINITACNIVDEKEAENDVVHEQLDLFIDQEEIEKNKNLNKALDEIKHTFGKSAVLRATSELDTSMVKIRNKQIGGHRK